MKEKKVKGLTEATSIDPVGEAKVGGSSMRVNGKVVTRESRESNKSVLSLLGGNNIQGPSLFVCGGTHQELA